MERDHEGQNRETEWREIMRDRTGRQNGENRENRETEWREIMRDRTGRHNGERS